MIINSYHEDSEIRAFNEVIAAKMNGTAPLEDEERFQPKVEIVLAPGEDEISVRDFPGYVTHTGRKTNEKGKIKPGTITPAISITGGRLLEDIAQGKKEQRWFPVYYVNPNDDSKVSIGYIEWMNGKPLDPATETTIVPKEVQYKPITLQPSQ